MYKEEIKMVKYELSKTPGGYYRIYKIGKKWATPFSPKEFINKKDAKEWAKRKKIKI